MQRYRYKHEAAIGDRIVFDNTASFIEQLPKIKIVGEVKALPEVEDIISVSFILSDGTELLSDIPYYLAQ